MTFLYSNPHPKTRDLNNQSQQVANKKTFPDPDRGRLLAAEKTSEAEHAFTAAVLFHGLLAFFFRGGTGLFLAAETGKTNCGNPAQQHDRDQKFFHGLMYYGGESVSEDTDIFKAPGAYG